MPVSRKKTARRQSQKPVRLREPRPRKVFSVAALRPLPLEGKTPDRKVELVDGKLIISDSSPSVELMTTLSIASALVDPKAVYPFRLQTLGDLSSIVTGVIAGSLNFDPSGVTEFAYLTNLFNEVRLHSITLEIGSWNPHADGYAAGRVHGPVYIACDMGKIGTTPTSKDQVSDCPNSVSHNTGSTELTKLHFKAPSDLNFSPVSAPAVEPYSGCYGSWLYRGDSFTASTVYLYYRWIGIYEFRSRS